jgi:hypothetical protein
MCFLLIPIIVPALQVAQVMKRSNEAELKTWTEMQRKHYKIVLILYAVNNYIAASKSTGCHELCVF